MSYYVFIYKKIIIYNIYNNPTITLHFSGFIKKLDSVLILIYFQENLLQEPFLFLI